jgi:glucose/arabinose dehydrogenase
MRASILIVFAACALPIGAFANEPPSAPAIISPEQGSEWVSAEDLHVLLEAFEDADEGDEQAGTQLEIVETDDDEVVWALDAEEPGFHYHLGDGEYLDDELDQSRRLRFDTHYLLRARYLDNSEEAETEWGAWAEADFRTLPSYENRPLEAADVLSEPTPDWTTDDGDRLRPTGPLALEIWGGAQGDSLLATVRLEPNGETEFAEGTGGEHRYPIALWVTATGDVEMGNSRVTFVTAAGGNVRAYLPAVSLADGGVARFWLAETGQTFFAIADDPLPNFDQPTRALPALWLVGPPGFVVEQFAGDLWMPVNLARHPSPSDDPDSPFLYVTELYGNIRVITRSGEVLTFAEGLLNFDPFGNIPGPGETGVTGICVHAETGDVYATMTTEVDDMIVNKIMRFTTDDGLIASGAEDVLVMAGEPTGASHQIQNCLITDEDHLIVAVGNGADQAVNASHTFFRGAILRMTLDGAAVPENPHYDPDDPDNPVSYHYAAGLRNPFGLTARADGTVWISENGNNIDRLAMVVPGVDLGWDGNDSSLAERAIFTWGPPAVAPTALTFLDNENFPASYRGRLFVNTSGPTYSRGIPRTGKIMELFSIPETVVQGETRLDGVLDRVTFLRYVGAGRGTLIGLVDTPDGLYFTSIYDDASDNPIAPGGTIWRISYVEDDEPTPRDDGCDCRALGGQRRPGLWFVLLLVGLASLRTRGATASQTTALVVGRQATVHPRSRAG